MPDGVTHELTKGEIDNSRQSNVMSLSVDNLNGRIGITTQIVKRGYQGNKFSLPSH